MAQGLQRQMDLALNFGLPFHGQLKTPKGFTTTNPFTGPRLNTPSPESSLPARAETVAGFFTA